MKKLLFPLSLLVVLLTSCYPDEMLNEEQSNDGRRTLTGADSLMLVSLVNGIVDQKVVEVREKVITGKFLREGLLPQEAAAFDPSKHQNATKEVTISLNANTAVFLEQDLRDIASAISDDVLKENYEYVCKGSRYKLMGGAMNFDVGQFVLIEHRDSGDATNVEVFQVDLYYGDNLNPGECYVYISRYDTDPKATAKAVDADGEEEAKKRLYRRVSDLKDLIVRARGGKDGQS